MVQEALAHEEFNVSKTKFDLGTISVCFSASNFKTALDRETSNQDGFQNTIMKQIATGVAKELKRNKYHQKKFLGKIKMEIMKDISIPQYYVVAVTPDLASWIYSKSLRNDGKNEFP